MWGLNGFDLSADFPKRGGQERIRPATRRPSSARSAMAWLLSVKLFSAVVFSGLSPLLLSQRGLMLLHTGTLGEVMEVDEDVVSDVAPTVAAAPENTIAAQQAVQIADSIEERVRRKLQEQREVTQDTVQAATRFELDVTAAQEAAQIADNIEERVHLKLRQQRAAAEVAQAAADAEEAANAQDANGAAAASARSAEEAAAVRLGELTAAARASAEAEVANAAAQAEAANAAAQAEAARAAAQAEAAKLNAEQGAARKATEAVARKEEAGAAEEVPWWRQPAPRWWPLKQRQQQQYMSWLWLAADPSAPFDMWVTLQIFTLLLCMYCVCLYGAMSLWPALLRAMGLASEEDASESVVPQRLEPKLNALASQAAEDASSAGVPSPPAMQQARADLCLSPPQPPPRAARASRDAALRTPPSQRGRGGAMPAAAAAAAGAHESQHEGAPAGAAVITSPPLAVDPNLHVEMRDDADGREGPAAPARRQSSSAAGAGAAAGGTHDPRLAPAAAEALFTPPHARRAVGSAGSVRSATRTSKIASSSRASAHSGPGPPRRRSLVPPLDTTFANRSR